MEIEQLIIKNLVENSEFTRKVLPFISPDYFLDNSEKIIFKQINSFISQYNSLPTTEALLIEIGNLKISESDFKSCSSYLKELKNIEVSKVDESWLIQQTEKFCQDKSIYNAVLEAVNILDDKTGTKEKGAIPDLLSKALAVSFDNNIGHDYIENYSDRYDFYQKKEEKVPFDLNYFNKITKNGLPKKSLTVILAGTGAGKSLFLCHHSAHCLTIGLNVLYITLEMAEERIAERIDANLLNIPIQNLENISKQEFERKFNSLKNKVRGKLIVKEYPTASASTTHFRSLINELALKKNFKPDIIMLDYLNICASSRVKSGAVNSYTYVKAIAEEVRGLAVEFDVPIITATQTTRSGSVNTDPDLTDVSESFGVPATADLMFSLITSEELENLNQIMIKQLKNRYNDPSYYKRFVVGIDRSRMKLYDVEESAQDDISDSGKSSGDDDDTPQFDRSKKFKKDFSGFKV